MSSKLPPVPPANRSPKGAPEAARPEDHAPDAGRDAATAATGQKANPDKIGQAGNSKVNTTNQGLQQDR